MNTTHLYPKQLFRSCTVSWFTNSSRLLGFLMISLSLHGLLFAMIPRLELSTTTGRKANHRPIYLTLNTAPSSNRMPRKPLTAVQPTTNQTVKQVVPAPSHHAKSVRQHLESFQSETRSPMHSKVKRTSHHGTLARDMRTTQLAVATTSPYPGEITPKPSPNPAAVAALLRRALQQHFNYPVVALQNSWEGKVVLNVRVSADGVVSAARILKASGYRILDRAAQHAVNDIGKIPAASPLLAGQALTFRVPVAYKLRH